MKRASLMQHAVANENVMCDSSASRRNRVTPGRMHIFLLCLIALSSYIVAAQELSAPAQPSSSKPLSSQSRMDLLRALDGELAYARVAFPKGKTGLKLQNGVISPPEAQRKTLISANGAAAKPGDLVH